MLTGKLAKVDLGNARIDLDPISRATLRGYLGGRGLNMRLLFPSDARPQKYCHSILSQDDRGRKGAHHNARLDCYRNVSK